MRMLLARRQECPRRDDEAVGLDLEHAGEVEYVAPSLRLDLEADGQAVHRIPVEDRHRDTRERVACDLLELSLETLRRQLRQVLEDDSHVTPSASRLSRRSRNHGRSSTRAGARCP